MLFHWLANDETDELRLKCGANRCPLLGGHHVVIRDENKPISEPGNVCMISIASVWEPDMVRGRGKGLIP